MCTMNIIEYIVILLMPDSKSQDDIETQSMIDKLGLQFKYNQ